MQPGDLNELIEFQRVSNTTNAGGGTVESWAAVGAKSWAKVMAISGREMVRAGQVGSNTMYEIGLYQRTDIDESDRIVRANGDVLRIRSAPTHTSAAFMTIMAEKVTP